jgi:ferredoxin-NADP reductase
VWEFETSFSQIIQRTPTIKSFRFGTRGEDVTHRAGQFFFVTIKVDGSEAIHHFTISSSPTEKGYLEFTKRITDSDYSKALDLMAAGDWARIRGPEGAFTLPERESKLAFLSGGIGITPLRSMLRYIVDEKLGHDVVLLYSNRDIEDIAFRDELDSMAGSHPGIRVEYVLSGSDIPAEWKGKTGYITEDLVAELIKDYQERVFYISGPPRMVSTLEEKLSAINVPSEQIKRDYFPGYKD